jgi:hypothetical protein
MKFLCGNVDNSETWANYGRSDDFGSRCFIRRMGVSLKTWEADALPTELLPRKHRTA